MAVDWNSKADKEIDRCNVCGDWRFRKVCPSCSQK